MKETTKKDRRGLASASPETRKRVAQLGGSAFHKKRGAKGKDPETKRLPEDV